MADEPAFDAVVARLDPAMVVVTAAAGTERDGCLVGFHAQAGIEPCRYVVWLSVVNRTYRIAGNATHLAVHALGAEDHPLAARFGGTTGDDVDKLADLSWTAGAGGAPLLADLPVRFTGRIVSRLDVPGGDHVGFVLEPVAGEEPAGRGGGEPFRLRAARDIQAGHPA